MLTDVRVNRKAADRVASGHPWIFASDITDRSTAQPGEAVRVLAPNARPLGVAHHSSSSQIALRMLTTGAVETIGRDFYLRRLAAAEAHRRAVVRDSNAYRVCHGEADLLPGLVIDRYADCLAIQTLSQGMDAARSEIVSCLEELYAPRAIVARNDAAVRTKEQLPQEIAVVAGELTAPVAITMNGLALEADLLHGQKTGIFLDQRENYLAAARYVKGRALDCFTSTGGFALHLAGRAESVEAIDSSGPSLDIARANAVRNHLSNIEFREADVFEFLAGRQGRYDLIVLDPPAFAKSRRHVDAAVTAYKEINLRALRLLDPGGILVSCSCSHHVGEGMFLELIAQAALDARRTLRVLERRTQAQDHPILLTVPETLYLKCLILEVM